MDKLIENAQLLALGTRSAVTALGWSCSRRIARALR